MSEPDLGERIVRIVCQDLRLGGEGAVPVSRLAKRFGCLSGAASAEFSQFPRPRRLGRWGGMKRRHSDSGNAVFSNPETLQVRLQNLVGWSQHERS